MEVGKHFIPFRAPADGPAGLLLAINPQAVSHISSYYDKQLSQNILRIHLINGRFLRIYESDAGDVLEDLGLSLYVDDWVLDLEKDLD